VSFALSFDFFVFIGGVLIFFFFFQKNSGISSPFLGKFGNILSSVGIFSGY
jgi:hypothetical protein